MGKIVEGEVDGAFVSEVQAGNADSFTVYAPDGGPDGSVPVLVVFAAPGSVAAARRRIEAALSGD